MISGKKSKENIALCKNNKFGKDCLKPSEDCLKPSEHILHLIFSAAQPKWPALLSIHFRTFVLASLNQIGMSGKLFVEIPQKCLSRTLLTLVIIIVIVIVDLFNVDKKMFYIKVFKKANKSQSKKGKNQPFV